MHTHPAPNMEESSPFSNKGTQYTTAFAHMHVAIHCGGREEGCGMTNEITNNEATTSITSTLKAAMANTQNRVRCSACVFLCQNSKQKPTSLAVPVSLVAPLHNHKHYLVRISELSTWSSKHSVLQAKQTCWQKHCTTQCM